MRTIFTIITLALLTACHGGDSKQTTFEAKRDSMLAHTRNPRVERMNAYHYATQIQCPWADAYDIVRQASDSLGNITDDEGTRYINNYVKLTLTYGGSQVFSHTFTKADFAPIADSRFFKRAVLQGMAFDKVEDGNVRFMASVGTPDSDEFVQFAITIDRQGTHIIEPAEVMDETLLDEDI